MPADKGVKAEIESFVTGCLSSGKFLDQLGAKLFEKMKAVVEEAVKSALKAVNEEMSQLRQEVADMKQQLAEVGERLVDRTDELEQYQRRNNIRLFGIKEVKDENTDEVVLKLCREQLGVELPEGAICRSHRTGKMPSIPGEDGKKRHRPIIVRFTSYQHRRLVFNAKKRLKGSGIVIREDLTSRRLEVYRRAAAQFGGKKTWTQDGRVLYLDQQGRTGVATRLVDLPPSPSS